MMGGAADRWPGGARVLLRRFSRLVVVFMARRYAVIRLATSPTRTGGKIQSYTLYVGAGTRSRRVGIMLRWREVEIQRAAVRVSGSIKGGSLVSGAVRLR